MIEPINKINKIEQTYRELVAEGREILKLFSGNPNDEGFVFPPDPLEDAYTRYFRNQDYHPHSKGLPGARQAIRDYYEERGATVDSENILLTAGTSESFFYLFSLLAKPGDNILAPNPAYPLFDHIAKFAGVELRHYSLVEDENWSIGFEEMRRRTNFKTRAIVLISPNNPTGAVAHADDVMDLVHWANLKNIPVICDEVFCEFFYGSGRFLRPAVIAKPKLCFTLNGISKMFALPALKLGWIAVTGEKSLVESAVDRLETMADTFLSCHIPIQQALPEIFAKGVPFLDAYRREVGRRRELAIGLLKDSQKIRFVEPVGGFYLMARVQTRLLEEEFIIALMKETGVFVHPGYFFDYERDVHVVLSYLTEPEKMERGLQALKTFSTMR